MKAPINRTPTFYIQEDTLKNITEIYFRTRCDEEEIQIAQNSQYCLQIHRFIIHSTKSQNSESTVLSPDP
jgi:hypothetical protein